MRILTLGTGAGRPTTQRCTCATALEYQGEAFLFDCGENIQIQLIRSPLKWGKLAAIFISHMHGDHLNGLPGLLGTLSLSERSQGLKIFGPSGMAGYLRMLQSCRVLWINYPLEVVELREAGVILDSPRYRVETAPLDHSIECWGYVFREKDQPGCFDEAKAAQLGIPIGPCRSRLVRGEDIVLDDGRTICAREVVGPPRKGRSVAHCLDTRPCSGSLGLARDVSVLIHEATFSHACQKEANAWGHSTARDAANTALEAGAKALLLTHISQRYLDDRPLLQEAQKLFAATEIARDLGVYEVGWSSLASR